MGNLQITFSSQFLAFIKKFQSLIWNSHFVLTFVDKVEVIGLAGDNNQNNFLLQGNRTCTLWVTLELIVLSAQNYRPLEVPVRP